MNAPCKGCPDRKPFCHGRCLKYQTYKKKHAEYLKSRYLEHDVDSYVRDQVIANKK